MGTFSYWIWIAAPPEGVYDLYTDIDRIGEWQEGKPRITERSGDARRAGSSHVTRRGPFASRSEVVVADRPTRQVVKVDGPLGLHAEIGSEFESEKRGTRLTVRLDARWERRALGRVLEWAVFNQRTARRELDNLKVIAEREHPDTTRRMP